MRSRSSRGHLGPCRIVGSLFLFAWLLLGLSSSAWAQDEDSTVVEEPESLEQQRLDAAVNFGAIDDLLESDSQVLDDPESYTYDPGARRDPFISLLQQRDSPEARAERPEGVAGLLIDEIRIEGIFMLQDGPVAQVIGASQETSFLLRPGDELWDGDVVRIDLDEVVFKQSVDDPTELKPFREVTKKLNPAQLK